MGKKLVFEKETLNKETGEIITTSKTFTLKTSAESFYMTFVDNLAGVLQIKSLLDSKLLSILCTKAEFNTGIINLSASLRNEICLELKTSTQNISNSLNRLKKLELITGEKGTFKINPMIFWKGTLEERTKLLKKANNNINIIVAINNFENEKTN